MFCWMLPCPCSCLIISLSVIMIKYISYYISRTLLLCVLLDAAISDIVGKRTSTNSQELFCNKLK